MYVYTRLLFNKGDMFVISYFDLFQDITNLPEGANVPSLGLSNKAVYENDIVDEEEEDAERHPNDLYPEMYFKPMALAGIYILEISS